MAEHSFQEVMRQFDRMCKAHAGCVDCPLAIKGTIKTKCSISSFVDESEYVMREIMTWAAEHPVVYPTWWEWLFSIGAVTRKVQPDVAAMLIGTGLLDPIPADLAQKLGIEPKEEPCSE